MNLFFQLILQIKSEPAELLECSIVPHLQQHILEPINTLNNFQDLGKTNEKLTKLTEKWKNDFLNSKNFDHEMPYYKQIQNSSYETECFIDESNKLVATFTCTICSKNIRVGVTKSPTSIGTYYKFTHTNFTSHLRTHFK